jgi:hypothetical protein
MNFNVVMVFSCGTCGERETEFKQWLSEARGPH